MPLPWHPWNHSGSSCGRWCLQGPLLRDVDPNGVLADVGGLTFSERAGTVRVWPFAGTTNRQLIASAEDEGRPSRQQVARLDQSPQQVRWSLADLDLASCRRRHPVAEAVRTASQCFVTRDDVTKLISQGLAVEDQVRERIRSERQCSFASILCYARRDDSAPGCMARCTVAKRVRDDLGRIV